MRHFFISLSIVVVFSCLAGQISAATFKTYAHVTIVPGADALLDHLPDSKTGTFALSGSAMDNVSVQISTPGVKTDVTNTLNQNDGSISFDYPLIRQNPKGNPSADRIITIVFE